MATAAGVEALGRVSATKIPTSQEAVDRLVDSFLAKSGFVPGGFFGEASSLSRRRTQPWQKTVFFPNFPLVLRSSEKVHKTSGGDQKLVFKTVPKMTKPEIAQFLHKVYDLDVKKVNTMNVEKRLPRTKVPDRMTFIENRTTEKKAIVTLHPPRPNELEALAIEKLRELIATEASSSTEISEVVQAQKKKKKQPKLNEKQLEKMPLPSLLPSWLKKLPGADQPLSFVQKHQYLRFVRKMNSLQLLNPFLQASGATLPSTTVDTEANSAPEQQDPKAILEKALRLTLKPSRPDRKWWTARR